MDATRIGGGQLLAGPGRKTTRGLFDWDDEGLYMATGLFGRKGRTLVAAWSDVVTLTLTGSESQAFSTRSSQRKALQVRHTRGRSTTSSRAVAYLTVGLKDDELVIKLARSPMKVRASMGPVLARFREETRD